MTTIATDWGEMAYRDSGSWIPPLLFLHSTGCDWSSPVTEKLPSNQRCIVSDFRGHGQSTVPTQPFTLADLAKDVLYLIDSLCLQGLVIVGHSLGGMVAMEVARRFPCIGGLVLLEGWTSLASAGSAFDNR